MRCLICILLILVLVVSCKDQKNFFEKEKANIDRLINDWHKDAAEGKFVAYFDKMDDDAYFIGTDASEKWTMKDFKVYCEPHFKDGSAWVFKTINREVFLNNRMDFAWFDEQLDTQMGRCMSSGVLVKTKKGWKIKHYQLSIAVPNELVKDFLGLVEKYQKK